MSDKGIPYHSGLERHCPDIGLCAGGGLAHGGDSGVEEHIFFESRLR